MGQWIALTNCVSCRSLYKEYREEGYEIDPPCDKCFPIIHPYNKAAFEVYKHCSTQLIMGMGGAISVNILAIDMIVDKLNEMYITDIPEEDKIDLFHDVEKLFSVVKNTLDRKAKVESAKNRKK